MGEYDLQSALESSDGCGRPANIRRPCNASDGFCYCAGIAGRNFAGPCLLYSTLLERNC